MIGLGCMRLSTVAPRDDDNAIHVIHAALDAGATLLDTADAYCLDDNDAGHNERLIARALKNWSGDRSRVTVATKGGLTRPRRRHQSVWSLRTGKPPCLRRWLELAGGIAAVQDAGAD